MGMQNWNLQDIFPILQLRYLQTLNSISAEKNSTIIFPFPVDIFDGWMRDKERNQEK